ILRKRLGFKGVIVTDDLLMGGVQETGLSLAQICERALEAGDDMLMISQTPAIDSRVWTELVARMQREPAFKAIVRAAAARIIKMKLDYLKGPDSVPLDPTSASVAKTLPDTKGESFFFEQACRATTIVKGGDIPLTVSAGTKMLLVGQFGEFLDEGKLRYPGAATYYLPYSPYYVPGDGEIERLMAVAVDYPIIIFCVANPNSMKVLEALKPLEARGTKIIAFSALSPAYLRNEPWVSSAIAVYGMGADSFAAGFAVLRGDFPAEGTMPISMLNGEL
ncbi:MAG TPA: glycoside hydrolase family 3 N-terminal domain-containing protein, partial [Spirochaetia bacterium]|nr:glycoside hydrolase family 3 N-terminal domain-containing protein [Spirochaetia bacterium]